MGLNLKSSICVKLSISAGGGDAGYKLYKSYEKIGNDYDHGGYYHFGGKQIMWYLKQIMNCYSAVLTNAWSIVQGSGGDGGR